ncbi:hypothetical protein N7448_008075 [Penicillium atrosanguineum]|nr:hypothetical protein N7448_008075 [Penicillium atrosanguineum]
MFMGTPHMGADKAHWITPLARLGNILLGDTNTKIVQVLQPMSKMLQNLQEEFHLILDDIRRNQPGNFIEIFCFYEKLEAKRLRDKVVPDCSAILSDYGNRSIYAKHMVMTKSSNAKDPGFVSVSDQLWTWTNVPEIQAASVPVQNGRQYPDGGPEHPYLIDSGGGPIFQGNQTAGRNININTLYRR